jgi:hypothetical protein
MSPLPYRNHEYPTCNILYAMCIPSPSRREQSPRLYHAHSHTISFFLFCAVPIFSCGHGFYAPLWLYYFCPNPYSLFCCLFKVAKIPLDIGVFRGGGV